MKEKILMKILIILYNRVSSAAQSLELQNYNAKRYLESIGFSGEEDFIIKLEDHDVSANKVKMDKRPNLMQLIRLIKEGKVKTVVAYKRDRLARNFYEAVDIAKIFIKYDVEVIFTASDEPPFTKKLSLEAFYAMFAQMEGQNISTRTADARKQYPSNIFGYKRVTDETGKRSYIFNDDKKLIIESLFNDFSKVVNEEQFLDFLMLRRKGLNDSDKIIKILTNPFYSGHYETKGNYRLLPHVEPIISLKLFLQVKVKIEDFKAYYLEKLEDISKQYLFTPLCGECGKAMKHRKDNQLDLGYFVCSSKHRRIHISAEEINNLVTQTVLNYVQSLSVSLVKKVIPKQVITAQKKVQNALASTASNYLDTSLKLSTYNGKTKSLVSTSLKEIQALKDKYSDLEQDLISLQQLSYEVKDMTQLLSQLHFTDQEIQRLIELFAANISVYETHLHIDLFLSSFVKEVDGL